MQNLLRLLTEHYDGMLKLVSKLPDDTICVHLRIPGRKTAMGRLLFDNDIDEYGDEVEYVGHYYDEDYDVINHVWFELIKVR